MYFWLCNVCSLTSKWNQFRYEFDKADTLPVLLALTETWLTPNVDDNLIKINGYSLFRKDRGSRGGGVALYVCQKTYAAVKFQINTNPCELICVDYYYKE